MVITTAEEKQLGGGADCDDELQAKCYSRQLILHPPKDVNGQKLSISVDYLPCFKDGVTGGGEGEFIVASCGNLILCSPGESYVAEGVYDLCNPYTKQWMELPPAPSKRQVVLGMICDPVAAAADDYCVPKVVLGGVGLEPQDSDGALFMEQLARQRFRVVRVPVPVVVTTDGGGGFTVEVLSCDDGRWEWSEVVVLAPQPLLWMERCLNRRQRAVACNGLLHWSLCNSGQLVVYDPYINEVRAIIERPAEAVPDIPPLSLLGASRGSVWVAQYMPRYHHPPQGWLIWQLSPDYDGWILRHRFNQCYIRSVFERRSTRWMLLLNALAIHPDNPNILYVLWSLGSENVVGRLDLATMKSKVLGGSKTRSIYTWHQTCVLTPPPSFLHGE